MNLITAIKAALATFTSHLTTHAFQSPSSPIALRILTAPPPHKAHLSTNNPTHQIISHQNVMPSSSNPSSAISKSKTYPSYPAMPIKSTPLNAALWTTMAELSANPLAERVCLVLEDIPLRHFVVLKTQERLMQYLPELKRFSVSLVGKGVGPGGVD
ncbi:hypothetical protein ACHAWO_010159 [Cyclotella atomus]|uniref:Uncharacterized protein n=1 Tax=Cyclotella atomus TaxID=382360 RepID=A0ABD3Q650_9STRA